MFELEDYFGDRLREERIRLTFTQEKLAEKTNISPLSIGQYENGRSIPSIKFIYALEKLGFDILYILLAVRKENITKEYSAETCKKAAKEIDLLELKLGGELGTEARVRVTNFLLNHFENDSKGSSELSTTQLITKILS